MDADSSNLTPAHSDLLTALMDPAASLAGIAQRLALSPAALLDLAEAPAFRDVLQRLVALEELRRRLVAAPMVTSALARLQKLLDRIDNPAELRRAATTIIRAATAGATTRRAADSEISRSSAAGSALRPPVSPSTSRHPDTSTHPSLAGPERRRRATDEVRDPDPHRDPGHGTQVEDPPWPDPGSPSALAFPGSSSTSRERERPAATDASGPQSQPNSALSTQHSALSTRLRRTQHPALLPGPAP